MAAGSTYTPLATTTLSSDQSSVTFSSISGSYTDFVLVAVAGITTQAGEAYQLRINADSGSNYSQTEMWGNGSTASSNRRTSQTYLFVGGSRVGSQLTLEDQFTLQFQNYSNATTYKSILMRQGAAATGTLAAIGLWRSTSAITSIVITPTNYNLKSGSTFTLYGIVAA